MTKSVLITGASVAGCTTAWWLSRHGFNVEVVEKAPAFRHGGQNVDVRGAAREVLRRMHLEQAAFDLSTGESGTAWVNEHDKVIAMFEAGASSSDSGPTAELEIRRGDIAQLIYEDAQKGAEFRFGDAIKDAHPRSDRVDVTFESGRTGHFDLVVVAEGVGSSTRDRLFPNENDVRWMDLTIAYFSIAKQPHDPDFARVYNTVGGRGATLKPARDERLGVYMGIYKKPEGEHKLSLPEQRRYMLERFSGDGWEFPRILDAVENVEDFYFDSLRQVRMKRWSKGRVVLTGDAAWCPTALSGIGTTLALVGGYVLAGELSKSQDHKEAFDSYEHIMRPFVREGQNIPQIIPRMLWPQTRFGLAAMRTVMRVAGTPLPKRLFTKAFARDSNHIELPKYEIARR
ncbi:FAD-dependent monooxygenase [Agrobacterium rubi]|uniref:FAD-binding monooxygenase n=1 Tax=Agrobacterium rubi TaxID=28099 RepID=A0AAE7R0D9_9HYPH|nr:FAD-dependent monooxygenase [Agrobacterium rubi]NTE86595.1 FAD-binding monooxygenase [Agrobacterium rubi]NTF02527.1 FAD-binding monooxygenase [Agrobacterium rubi]NTF36772.1 FAD-binding monooxygenase [Agrobacterium rubi]OCJ55610.1 FAD-binding monooxygenase [Agrobacterium rubi]QTF99220.1 FAD-binding monooxygenase [Agrobacterium rubi]